MYIENTCFFNALQKLRIQTDSRCTVRIMCKCVCCTSADVALFGLCVKQQKLHFFPHLFSHMIVSQAKTLYIYLSNNIKKINIVYLEKK